MYCTTTVKVVNIWLFQSVVANEEPMAANEEPMAAQTNKAGG